MSSSRVGERLTLITMPPAVRRSAFAHDVAQGLTDSPKHLPCHYFYDAEGSRLFEEICTLPEYYLTRAEAEILREHAAEIAGLWAGPVDLVELGSGSAVKTRLLLDAFLRRQERLRYIPMDISATILEESSRELLRAFPSLTILALAAEYQQGLEWLRKEPAACPRLVLWLGSNIGNFERTEAASFLRQVGAALTTNDRLLVGIDLRKDRSVLEPAYDDARGVTARFNLNLLARINRDLHGHFDLSQFRHRAVYNEEVGRMEIFLVSTVAQKVAIERLNLEVPLAAGETIHTENSYKYSLAEIEHLAVEAGFQLQQQWLDRDRRFSVNLLRLRPKDPGGHGGAGPMAQDFPGGRSIPST